MTKEDFCSWYTEFCNLKKGMCLPPSDFYDKVEKAQSNLREKLGGIRLLKKVTLKNGQMACPFEEVDELSTKLVALIPEYFFKYGLNRLDYSFPTIVRQTQFADMKHGKHITRWMSDNSVDKTTQKEINDIISKLGGVWSKNKANGQNPIVNMTTSPKAFALLGRYGPDNGSCFGQGRCNQHHKYMLSFHPNSFVLLIQSTEEEEQENSPNVIGRMWGIADEDFKRFHINNIYVKKGEIEGNVLLPLNTFFSELLGTEAVKTNGMFRANALYNNTNGYTFSAKEDTLTEPKVFAVAPLHYIFASCVMCHTLKVKENLQFLSDHNYYCDLCAQKLNKCEFTGKVTPRPLIAALYEGKTIQIAPETLRDGHFVTCNVTHKVIHKSEAIMDGGLFYVKDILTNPEHNAFRCKDCLMIYHSRSASPNRDTSCYTCAFVKTSASYRPTAASLV